MLEYGDAFLEQNREALKALEAMSPAAFAVAAEMAPHQAEVVDEDEEELVAA
ncbi:MULTISPECIES: hypothetical protein [unclassified Caulobacter]|jgi:hypothetical protein|uniref:hypothetical protein n=1 Tax=unclassified Caulobacter TaxID=2648921 RepID=UPI001554671C|nr:hypothetical protein [Caulobacter sp. RHG1]NQE65369.1 hypothetical protein [Caulobacter sp. RHG1]